MTVEDIRVGLISLLREKTDVVNITGEDLENTKDYASLEKGADGQTLPTLQVMVTPVTAQAVAAGHHMDKSVLVDITYFEDRYTSIRILQKRLEELQNIMLPYFKIGDRAFSPVISSNITDGAGHCVFTLEYTDTVPFDVDEPLAEEISIELKEDEGWDYLK